MSGTCGTSASDLTMLSPGRRGETGQAGKVLKEIMGENFPNLTRYKPTDSMSEMSSRQDKHPQNHQTHSSQISEN